jgi:predicted nucleotidyltransferase component of viral defense system
MKTEPNYFLTLVERAMREPGRVHMRPVIEKELLHYDILFALDNANLLDKLTFQGGTALRLCYGASRFSEDLDFAGGHKFDIQNLMSMKDCLEKYLFTRYNLQISIKEPKDLLQESENKNVKVNKWQIRVMTHPERKDIPKQMIKIEIANVSAYTNEARQLVHNYDFLPDNYRSTIVMTETLDEIFADKIVAFVNCQAYVRYRDIWDLHWLKQKGATLNMILVKHKLADYRVENYGIKLNTLIGRLGDIIFGPEFKKQMTRFLPEEIQQKTLLSEKFLHLLLRETKEILQQCGSQL